MEITREVEIENQLNNDYAEIKKGFVLLPGNKEYHTKHKIICGDCNSAEVFNYLKTKTVRLVVTSPPYNSNVQYDVYKDNKSIEDYNQNVIRPFLETTDKLLEDGGRVAINLRDIKISTGSRFPPLVYLYKILCEDKKYKYRGAHIWYKGREESSTAWGSWLSPVNPSIIDLYEYVYVFQKSGDFPKKDIRMNKDEFIESNLGVWKIRPVKKMYKGNGEVKNILMHPCPFPPELPLRVIKLYSYPGDTVIDPFGGIGSTTIAAFEAGRNSICIDISENYCKFAEKYIKEKCEGIDLEIIGV